jgi:D-amino peptidase
MRAYISVDLEGVNGILHSSQTQPNEPGYNRALELMHAETNAVIKGLLAGGVKDILVNDSHWDMRNLHIEKVLQHKGVTVRSGWQKPFSMVSGIDGPADFAVFVGYHARAGHATGVLSHTYRAQIFFEVKLNGVPVGETGLNAALAGCFGVPVAMVTGDDTVLEEARDLLGDIVTAQVKTAVSRYSAVFHPHEETLKLLQLRAQDACQKKHWMLFKPTEPVVIEITFFDPSMADAAELIPQVHRINARTIEILADGYPQAFRVMLAVGALGASRRDPYFS